MRIHLGCGTYPVEGYINSDILSYPGCQIVDLEEKLPYPDDSAEVILMSHTYNIIKNKEQLLNEIRRVLMPGGIFRIWESPERIDQAEFIKKLYEIGFHEIKRMKYDQTQIGDNNIFKARGTHVSFVLEATK